MNVRAVVAEKPKAARIALALGLVYVVWGSTYLAIRVAVETLPPLTMAGVRFLIAGFLLFGVARRGAKEKIRSYHWRAATIVGGCLLLGGNGLVVLAEDRGVPSGIAALLVGTVPLWMAAIGRVYYKDRLPAIGIAGVLIGFAGVAILAKPSGSFPAAGSIMLVGASLVWSLGSLYARTAPLPRSALLSTSLEMIAGGALLTIAGAARGELSRVHVSAFSLSSALALLYLIVVGALVGYTAYVWALHNAPTSLVSTYAFVNPVIAVLLGAVFVHERVTGTDLVAGALIVGSVALIIAARPKTAEASPAGAPPAVEDAGSEAAS